jgi:hypothetical protein
MEGHFSEPPKQAKTNFAMTVFHVNPISLHLRKNQKLGFSQEILP